MYPWQRLTWDDEVRLSDALHNARAVRARLARGEPATSQDETVLAAGVAATNELVIAHAGLAKRIASDVLFGAESSSTIDFEDLVQVGMMAMFSVTNSFDARRRSDGLDKDTGNRFSVYSRLYIKRDMYRALKRGDAALTGSIAAADRTREWLRYRESLEQELGRRPTPREVSEFCGIALDTIDMTLIGRKAVLGQPATSGSAEDGDAPILDAVEVERTEEIVDDLAAEEYITALDRLLRRVLPPEEADAFMLYLGVDRATPRAISEVASELGMKVAEANEIVGSAVARLRHPQNVHRVRTLAAEALHSIQDVSVLVGSR